MSILGQPPRPLRVVLWTAVVLFTLVSYALGDESYFLDFLYVDANTGEAAGGHMGLRLGEEVFHYQFYPDGTFLLVREPWNRFRLLYNELLNRSIARIRISLTGEGYRLIRDHFALLLLRQKKALEEVRHSGEEIALLTDLVAGGSRVAIPYLGLYRSDQGKKREDELQQMICREYGFDFLQRAGDEAAQNIHQHLAGLSPEVPANTDTTWGRHLRKLLAKVAALNIIAAARPLRRDAVVGRMADEPLLDVSERTALVKYQKTLSHSILALLSSDRPGSSEAVLRQYARLQAVRLSLKTGHMLTLGMNWTEPGLADFALGENEVAVLIRQLHHRDVLATRDLFIGDSGPSEMIYHRLEAARWRLSQSHVAVHAGVTGSIPTDRQAARMPGYADVIVPEDTRARFANALGRQRERHIGLQQQLSVSYNYKLRRQNCVTKLFFSLNRSFPDQQTGQALLGGWIDPEHHLLFCIPHEAYRQIAMGFPHGEEIVYPSRRLRGLSRIYGGDETVLTRIREGNILTSSLYTWRPEDTSFLFFTDDTVWSRPFLGLMNLSYSALYSAAGVLSWPLDGGGRVWCGVCGMLYSLPELVFANIRKGTYSTADVFSSPGLP